MDLSGVLMTVYLAVSHVPSTGALRLYAAVISVSVYVYSAPPKEETHTRFFTEPCNQMMGGDQMECAERSIGSWECYQLPMAA